MALGPTVGEIGGRGHGEHTAASVADDYVDRTRPQDGDNDGTPDYLDDDCDNDGVPDLIEGHDAESCLASARKLFESLELDLDEIAGACHHDVGVHVGDHDHIGRIGHLLGEAGVNIAGGVIETVPLLKENGFLPDLGAIDPKVAQKAKIHQYHT